jgi:hypothetical protein
VFELEGFLAQFRFYYGKNQIKALQDIERLGERRGEKRYNVVL